MKVLKYTILFILGTAGFAQAVDEKILLQPYPKEPLLNEIIAFKAIQGHHFNLKSKSNCGNGYLIKEDEGVVECQMFAPGSSELQLFVCDDAKTFCRREIVPIKTQSPSGIVGWLKYYKEGLLNRRDWSSPFKSGVSPNPVARGFTANELKKTLEAAQREKKKLLLYVTQLSCPPCRLMKDMTFASDEFQALLKDYVPVQVDMDLDIEPDKMKRLKIRGTPTTIVLDGDFKEFGRATRVMSPTAFKSFFASLPAVPPAVVSEEADPVWMAEYEKLKSAKDKIEFLGKIKTEGIDFNAHYWINYVMSFYEPVMLMKLPADQALFSRAMSLLGAFELRMQEAPVDELQKAYNLNTYYEIMVYFYGLKKRDKDAKSMRAKQMVVLESFPKLPGVVETPQLAVLKAEASEDPLKKKQVLEQLRAQNQNDYTYDFWEANEAMMRQDFQSALVAVDKSLAVAKDRSWQKAFLMKIEILIALNRKDEALKEISDLLGQMKLPSNSAMKVHSFVQELRKLQLST